MSGIAQMSFVFADLHHASVQSRRRVAVHAPAESGVETGDVGGRRGGGGRRLPRGSVSVLVCGTEHGGRLLARAPA